MTEDDADRQGIEVRRFFVRDVEYWGLVCRYCHTVFEGGTCGCQIRAAIDRALGKTP